MKLVKTLMLAFAVMLVAQATVSAQGTPAGRHARSPRWPARSRTSARSPSAW